MKKIVIVFFFLCSCNQAYHGRDICSADEFVMDSYKIQEGKFSILELEGIALEKLPTEYLEEYEDKIAAEDILQICVYHPKRPDLKEAIESISSTIGFKVIDKKIDLPRMGSLEIEGLTLSEAQKKIQKSYQDLIGEMEVYISYKSRNIKKVDIAGLTQISSYPVDGKVKLFEILSKAKIPPDANLFKSYVQRDNKSLAIDFYKLLKEGDMSQNIVMKGGDKIYVAESNDSTLMVTGEVYHEKVIPLLHGSISLREAIAMAGGIPYTGDKSTIQVIRGNITRPKIYVLSFNHLIHLPNRSLLLMPGDIVYVASKPITEWNRFISQIIPTIAGAEMVTKGVKGVGVWVP